MDIANCFRFFSDNPQSKIPNPRWVGVLALAITLICGGAWAQQPAKIPRIGYLTGSSPATNTTPDLNADAFRQGLRDLGYVEGKNIVVEYRYLEGKDDRNATFLAELQQLKVDVIVVISMSSIRAAKQATTTIPIGALVSYASDDVANFKRAPVYVDKILKGAKPADLPVEQPTEFALVFNLKTAKQIGVTIPPVVLARASRLIK